MPNKVAGSLRLNSCDLRGIILPTEIGEHLILDECNLEGVKIPKVGKRLLIKDAKNVPNAVYNCGIINRTITCYKNLLGELVVTIGCFVGTKEAAIAAIKAKYLDHPRECKAYCDKVELAFSHFEKNKK